MRTDSIKEKVVIITGGATGIGLATAQQYVRYGAKVVIAGRNAEAGAQALEALKQIGHQAEFIQTDVSKSESVVTLFRKTETQFGKIDIVFNNAGIEGSFLPIDQTDEQELNSLMDTNIKGVWLAIRQAIIQFKAQGSPGVIINTSSWLSHGAMIGSGIYSATKAALDGLTKAVAIEAAPFHIRINNVNPGYILTPMFRRFMDPESEAAQGLIKHVPTARFGQPEDIAELVVWLSSDAASYITGQCIVADGGLTIGGQRS